MKTLFVIIALFISTFCFAQNPMSKETRDIVEEVLIDNGVYFDILDQCNKDTYPLLEKDESIINYYINHHNKALDSLWIEFDALNDLSKKYSNSIEVLTSLNKERIILLGKIYYYDQQLVYLIANNKK